MFQNTAMVPSNVIQRTFKLKYQDSLGTCFTIDVDGRQYLLTAKHVVPNIAAVDAVEVQNAGVWHSLPVALVGTCPDPIDIIVLALKQQLSPTHPLPADSNGIYFGQDIYFVGFPFGLGADMGAVNADFPVPFVKKGILSSIVRDPSGARILYLDGNNNPGFSGRPAVFALNEQRARFCVAPIVSGYRFDPQPVYVNDQATQLVSRHNTGIVISYDIIHAIDAIRANPIGFELPRT